MRRQKGFTVIELMVVIAILGIMTVSAVPTYKAILQRTYGREAVVMAKQLIDAQIIYFLENDKFFPDDGAIWTIYNSGEIDPVDSNAIQKIRDALNVTIPTGHHLDFYIVVTNEEGKERFYLKISAQDGANFDLFRNGQDLIAILDKDGSIDMLVPDL